MFALLLATTSTPSLAQPPGNAACLDCHGAPPHSVQAETYAQSPHGVLACERCHAEAAGEDHAKDPNKPLQVPEGREGRVEYSSRCIKCHAGISRSYDQSFHALAIHSGDSRAATCVDCHGVHDIFNQADPRATTSVAKLAGTCGTADCHPGAPQNFAKGREHVDLTEVGTGTDTILHYIWKFFLALILFDTMKDGPIVMFELLRRIRG